MAICPYCKQKVTIENVRFEKKGIGFIEQERMYVCPFCDYILGFSYRMR